MYVCVCVCLTLKNKCYQHVSEYQMSVDKILSSVCVCGWVWKAYESLSALIIILSLDIFVRFTQTCLLTAVNAYCNRTADSKVANDNNKNAIVYIFVLLSPIRYNFAVKSDSFVLFSRTIYVFGIGIDH